MALTIPEVDEIRARVERKGWMHNIHHPEDGLLFDRIVECASALNEAERELFGNLVDAYLYISDDKYEIFALWAEIKRHTEDCARVYVAPLKKRHEKRTKSGDRVNYTIATLFSEGDKYESVGTPFSGLININDNDCIVLVDDFIGTGETVEECLEEFRRDHPEARVIIATLVAQEWGLNRLAASGNTILTNHVRKKALSDAEILPGNSVENALLYDGLEARIGISHEFRRGYGNSEALVTVIRTPDNTLPIFWKNQQGEEFRWPALFPRR